MKPLSPPIVVSPQTAEAAAGPQLSRRAKFMQFLRSLWFIPESPELVADHRFTILVRTRVAAWVAALVVPFTIFSYILPSHPRLVTTAVGITLLAELGIGLVFASLSTPSFRARYHVPFFVLVGLVCSGTEATLLQLTGGAARSEFFFPYFLILFGIATLFPARAIWAVIAAMMCPVSFLVGELLVQGHLGHGIPLTQMLLLVDGAFIALMGNRITTRLYFREVQNRHALEAANQQLRELDQAKSDFFANLSHDLKTPLNVIIAPLEAVARKAPNLDARSRRYLELAVRGAKRLDAMINDLLELARIDAGVSSVHFSRVDVGGLVEGLVESSGPLASNLGLQLEFEPAPNQDLSADVDSDKFERVVMNLISNAMKFSEPGGRVSVRLRASNDEGTLELSVRDEGPGIAAEDLTRIFSRFVRGKEQNKGRISGVGIGLAVVREFVELHHGEVFVTSAEGQGSTFTVRLPRRVEGVSPEPEPKVSLTVQTPPHPNPALQGDPHVPALPRLLLVEDDDETRVFLAGELGQGMEVLAAPDGDTALRMAQERPDLVLLDVMLGAADGIAVCERLRRHPATAKVPILIYSARADLPTRLRAFKAGADDFVHKPVDLLELRARFGSLLRRAAPQVVPPMTKI